VGGTAGYYPETIGIAPTAGHATSFPNYLWVLLPIAFLLFAAMAGVIFEPAEEPLPASIALAITDPDVEAPTPAPQVIPPPPGPLVILGFATRRVLRSTIGTASQLLRRRRD
jgi:hypothetical protein